MLFSYFKSSLLLFSTLAIRLTNASVAEAQVNDIPVRYFPTSDVLQSSLKPPTTFPDGTPIPPHLQYTIYLDQAHILTPSILAGSAGDPEAAAVLSAGEWSADNKNQEISRCFGGSWMFFHTNVTQVLGNDLINTGAGMFTRMTTSKEGDYRYCPLTFHWNEDYTKFSISGYFNEVFKSNRLASFLRERGYKLTAELKPYWAWKFGLPVEDSEIPQLEDLDQKCCPPKDETACLGGDTIGKPGCETISKACGRVSSKDLPQCAMWVRKNKITIVPVGYYHIYPIGDANGEPTGFFPAYLDAMSQAHVKDIFYGLENKGDKLCAGA